MTTMPAPSETPRIHLDLEKHTVTVDGKDTYFAPKEYLILSHFAKSKGRAVSRKELMVEVWGHEKGLEIDTRTVDQHIARIRRKVKGPADRFIETLPNFGYRGRNIEASRYAPTKVKVSDIKRFFNPSRAVLTLSVEGSVLESVKKGDTVPLMV